MVTGDSKNNAISTAKELEFLNQKSKLFSLTEDSKDKLNESIRHALSSIKNIITKETPQDLRQSRISIIKQKLSNNMMEKLKETILLVSGDSLDIIFQDTYLLSHFLFIAFLSSKIIAFSLDPMQKAILLKQVQKRFYKNPIILAIGDGIND